MSLSRTSDPFRRWPRLRPQFQLSRPLSSSTTTGHNKLPRSSHNHTQHNNNNAIPKQNRLFHSTPSPNAARSPTVRRSQGVRIQPAASRETPQFYNQPVEGSKDAREQFLDTYGWTLWAGATKAGALDEKVRHKTFMKVALALYEEAYSKAPSGAAIRGISDDVELVFSIGHVVSIGDPGFREWILTACMLADSRTAVVLCAARHLRKNKSAPKTPLFDKLESIAVHERNAVAMTVQAEAFGLREEYHKALPLAEQAIQLIRLDTTAPPLRDGFPEGIQPPWEVYEWLMRKTGDDAAADKAVEFAALKYQQPQALVRYAAQPMKEGDLELYEECMSKAASASHPDACCKLANFYLLTSTGRYPRRGEKDSTEQQQFEKEVEQKWSISSLFGRSLRRSDYYKLAREWYEMACVNGSHEAALTLSLLLRQEGDLALGRHYLDMAAADPALVSSMRGYRVNWDNPNVTMDVDFGRLAVC